MTSGIGVLLASAVATVLTALTTDEQMQTWGWRAGYAIGTILVIAVFFMRRGMNETAAFEELLKSGEVTRSPVRSLIKDQWPVLAKSVAIAGYANIVYYSVASYLPTQLSEFHDFSPTAALFFVTVLSAIFAASAPWWGGLSDRVGRKPLAWFAAIMLIAVPIPAYLAFDGAPMFWVWLAALLLLLPLMAIWGSYGAWSPELFSGKYRYTGTAISYNLGNSIFGGLTPLLSVGLIAVTNWAWSPALLMVLPSLLMIPILLVTPETYRRELV